MADDTQASASVSGGKKSDDKGITIPEEVRQKFSDVIDLILGSESMNAEERQYWVNILPIMTPDQLQQLRDILHNERKQLAAIDAKYSKEIDAIGQEQFMKQVVEERRRRREERVQKEKAMEIKEEEGAEALLEKIQEEA
ncbi:hypothetical protein A2635_05370 [Candidatus Peribacteria bacterium RIFCSPHIGHO2_01_FULL_51_9]|nr:MAG: hypothetical protein A2635_05370 [Candidatus Peribacteria bacterium RIFCSPHIGHO2_01_FULL_51_9]